jgi:hypothetical protein
MKEWLKSWLPEATHAALDWFFSPAVLAVSSATSVVLFVASLLAIPWFVARLPEDYFCHRRDRPSLMHLPDARLRMLVLVLRNLGGVLLLLAGIAMLVLPGQGVITILVSLILLSFPGKRRLLARIAGQHQVLSTLNRIRKRAGQPPLEVDGHE